MLGYLPTLILCAAFSATLAAQNETAKGSVSGTVTSDDGSAVGGMAVILQPTLVPDMEAKPVPSAYAVTDASGTFAINVADLSGYTVCIDGRGTDLVNPCLWQGSQTKVNLSQKAAATGLSLSLRHGTVVHFRVEDPESRLISDQNPKAPSAVLVGVWTKAGQFVAARKLFEDAKGQEYEVVVPFGETIHPWIGGNDVRLIADDGTVFDGERAAENSVTTSAKQRRLDFHYIVTGPVVRRESL